MKYDTKASPLIVALLLLDTLAIIGLLVLRDIPTAPSVTSFQTPNRDCSELRSKLDETREDLEVFQLWYDLSQPGVDARGWKYYQYNKPEMPFGLSMMIPKNSQISLPPYEGSWASSTVAIIDAGNFKNMKQTQISLAVNEDQPTKTCIDTDPNPYNVVKWVKINGNKFCLEAGGDNGAGNYGYVETYTYQQGKYTLEVTTTDYGSTCAAYDNIEDCARGGAGILKNAVDSMRIE